MLFAVIDKIKLLAYYNILLERLTEQVFILDRDCHGLLCRPRNDVVLDALRSGDWLRKLLF